MSEGPPEPSVSRMLPILISCAALGVSVFTWYYSNLRVARHVLASVQDTDVFVTQREGATSLRAQVEARFFVVNTGNRPAAIDSIMLFALTAPLGDGPHPARQERCADPDEIWRSFFQGLDGEIEPPAPVIEPGKIMSVSADFEFSVGQSDLYPASDEMRGYSASQQTDVCLIFYVIDDLGRRQAVAAPYLSIGYDQLKYMGHRQESGPWRLL